MNKTFKPLRVWRTLKLQIIKMKKYKAKKVNGKNVGVHRLVMEKHLRRKLFPHEIIHHIDGNPENNELDNLALFPTKKAHTKFHYEKGDYKLKAGSNKKRLIFNKLKCSKCDELKEIKEFLTDAKHHLGIRNICRDCYNLQRRKRRQLSEL